MRILKWLLGIVAVAALAFFALAPGIIERGMNKVERASPWPVSGPLPPPPVNTARSCRPRSACPSRR